ncbi:putative kinetochore protein Spc25 [Apostichopus japonicus]|uniref:Kinetochore protein SPC25 n=1 Tax=Stichopus japonicus TaxID=307972 RepID=A0A2G8LME8_STIJA|nr:putative kinetochore protein Spc25 [Apostichopus japonicus]
MAEITPAAVPQESSTELAILTSNLQQVQHKVITQWTSKSLDQYLQQNHISHEQWLKQATEQIKEIRGQLDKLHEESAQSKEAVAAQKRKADEIECAIKEAAEKRQKLMFQKEEIENDIRHKSQELKQEAELLETQQKATRLRLSELTKAEEFFKERMGLRFKKLDSENLQFVFTNIDPKDHERVYYFTIKVIGKEYHVTDCCPQVEAMEELVQKLNKSNNLMEFAVTVRQKFKLVK